jgi:hypothetical protein
MVSLIDCDSSIVFDVAVSISLPNGHVWLICVSQIWAMADREEFYTALMFAVFAVGMHAGSELVSNNLS